MLGAVAVVPYDTAILREDPTGQTWLTCTIAWAVHQTRARPWTNRRDQAATHLLGGRMQHSCSSERTGPCGGAHWSRGQAAGAARARSSGTGGAARRVRWRPRKASCWMRGEARSWGQQGRR